jgi:hypothetical protein
MCNLGRTKKGVIMACFQVLRKAKYISLRTMKFKTMTTQIRNRNVNHCTLKFSAGPEKFQETTTINSEYKQAMVTMQLKEYENVIT